MNNKESKITIGRRVYPDEKGVIHLRAGDYVKDPKEGYFVIKTPNGIVASIMNHKVIEHEDGTITVSPSVVVKNKYLHEFESKDQFMILREERGSLLPEQENRHTYEVHWHGFLEKGIWREA